MTELIFFVLSEKEETANTKEMNTARNLSIQRLYNENNL